jgi:hypothetical protein
MLAKIIQLLLVVVVVAALLCLHLFATPFRVVRRPTTS